MSILSRAFLSVAIATFAASSVASAQCPPRPDGLDGGPCCADTKDRLPRFPGFRHGSLDICWRDCNVDNVLNCVADWKAVPQRIAVGGVYNCGERQSQLTLTDAAGVVKWRGRIHMTYSRTWQEAGPNGDLQVWRFLTNGDMFPTAAAGGIPCPVPPCVPVHGNRARFTGYIDYARDCNGRWETAWMLTHACDQIDHNAAFPRGGAFHPDRSYTFVGPAAGFVPGPLQPREGGGSGFEVLRRSTLPAPGTTGYTTCQYEEQAQHGLNPQQDFCLCGPQTAVPQWAPADLLVSGACGSFLTTPGVHVPSFISMGIGSWTDPTRFPGLECLRWNVGGYQYNDPCIGVATNEVWFGVTTLRGFPARQILFSGLGATLPLTFIDQANSLRSGGTVMNVPYRSDHILNLNH